MCPFWVLMSIWCRMRRFRNLWRYGMCFVNTNSDLSNAWVSAVLHYLKSSYLLWCDIEELDPWFSHVELVIDTVSNRLTHVTRQMSGGNLQRDGGRWQPLTGIGQHTNTWTKWPTFSRQHTEIYFLELNFLYLDSYCNEMWFWVFNWQEVNIVVGGEVGASPFPTTPPLLTHYVEVGGVGVGIKTWVSLQHRLLKSSHTSPSWVRGFYYLLILRILTCTVLSINNDLNTNYFLSLS